MKPVNLLPPERRPHVSGEGDPRVAWAILGFLGLLLVLVVVSIGLSNKAKTLDNEATALQAEADKHQAAVALIPTGADSVTEEVRSRTLLVGGLSAVRFKWDDAIGDLTQSLPRDVTIDTINAISAGTDPKAEPGSATMVPTMTLAGCTSGWVGYSRFLTWLKQMPHVNSVTSNSSAVSAAAPAAEGTDEATQPRNQNCGPRPLNFSLLVAYRPHSADLLGLPRPDAGSTSATGAPAAATATTTAPAGG